MTLEELAFDKAQQLIIKGVVSKDTDVFELTDTLIKIEKEKQEKIIISDSLINYNDEILSIVPVGSKETIDISVTGDNLFYCNDILTKNSWGLPQTADLQFAIISTEVLEETNRLMIKQLKNRYNDTNYYNKFLIGVDRSKMKLFNIIQDEGFVELKDEPIMDKSEFGQRDKASKFDSFT